MTRPKPARPAPSKKVTISLPEELFRRMEKVRRADHVDRSSWVQRAVAGSLDERSRIEADRAYIESYRNDPEETVDAEILAKLAAAAWADLDE